MLELGSGQLDDFQPNRYGGRKKGCPEAVFRCRARREKGTGV